MSKFLSFVICLFAGSAFAGDYSVTSGLNAKTLSLDLKEVAATAAACDLYVESFEYLADVRIFNLNLAEVTNCPLDSIAPRKAHFEWNMPFNFTATKSVYLRVNKKIIGMLIIRDQSVMFKPRGK